MSDLKILVEGIGGIGGYLSAKLISNGYDLTLITKNKEINQSITEKGLRLRENGEINSIKSKAFVDLSEIEGEKFDIILLIMKATGVIEAAKNSLKYLKQGGYMVTMQNGVVEDEVLASVDNKDIIIPSIIGWGGTMIEPGLYEKTTPGKIHIGELNGETTPRLTKLSEILNTAVETEMTNNIRGALWAKLAINCCITTIGAITGQKLGDMLKTKDVRDIFLQTYREVVVTAEAYGIKLEKIASDPYALYLPEHSNILKKWMKDTILKIVARKYSETISSSLQSLQRGRKTEIDYLNGYVVKMGEKKGIDVSTNKVLVKFVKEIEDEERSITNCNIVDLIKEINN